MIRLLIVDDEPLVRQVIRHLLASHGWDVEEAGSVSEARDRLASSSFDVVLADVILPPGENGTALLGCCGKARVVMLSAHGDLDSAVEAMRRGAVDYVRKPYSDDDLLARLARAAGLMRAVGSEGMLVGESATMRAVQDQVRRVAPTDLSVLVSGEPGTGKRLAAEAVHRQSARREGPFVVVGCEAIAEDVVASELFGHEPGAVPGATEARAGPFESANGGTVFLDEVGELSASAQKRLLRVLAEREVRRVGASRVTRIDVRVVAATSLDLQAMVDEKKFNRALFDRLQDFQIRLPPLRHRGEDVLLLARSVLEKECARKGGAKVALSAAARAAMLAYGWPGNVRQLVSALKCALVSCDGEEIGLHHLPESIRAPQVPGELEAGPSQAGQEPDDPWPLSIDGHIRRIILKYQDRLTEKELAAMLGITTVTLWRWRRDHDLPRPQKPRRFKL